MDNEYNLYKLWAKVLCIIVCTAVLTVGGCNMVNTSNKTRAAVELVKLGSSPLEAECLLWARDYSTECVILASRK